MQQKEITLCAGSISLYAKNKYGKRRRICCSVPRQYKSLVVRKPAFCICENKDADQPRGNREADQRLCFRYTDGTIPLLPKIRNFKPPAIFCGSTARFVSDLIGNAEDRYSHNEAHNIPSFYIRNNKTQENFHSCELS